MNLFESTVPQLIKMIKNLDAWLETGVEHAKKKNFDPEILLAARLAPDQYALGRQIQVVCDTAKFMASRLSGKEAPAHADTEKTLDEYRARIRACLSYLESFKSEDFAGAEARRISLPWMEGKWVNGLEYTIDFALPNFYFHITTAYAILRHNGVELGKRNYIGSLPMHDPEPAAS